MVAVPCVVGALFLWIAHGRPQDGQTPSEEMAVIFGRAMSADAAFYFWHLAISALSAALLSILSFLLLDLPRVLRREPRPDIDWHDMVGSLKDIPLLFEKRVTPAGPRPGEPESANPLDYQTAMQQLHSMLGIEGEIPPEPQTEDQHEQPDSRHIEEEPPGDQPPGPAVNDVETIESLIGPAAEDTDQPQASRTIEASPEKEPTPQPAEPPSDKPQKDVAPEPEPQAAEEPVREEPPAEPEPLEAETEPQPVDQPAGTPAAEDTVPPEPDQPNAEPPVDEDGDEPLAPPTGETATPESAENAVPTVRVKDSPFAQRHRLSDPLFETVPPPPGSAGQEEGDDRRDTPVRVVDDLLDEPVAFLFDRPSLPGLLRVKASEWDVLPAAEQAEPPSEPPEQAEEQPREVTETEWVDEDEAPAAETAAEDILDVEPEPAEFVETGSTPSPPADDEPSAEKPAPAQPTPATPEQPAEPEPDSDQPAASDENTIDELLGEQEESSTIDELLGRGEEDSTIEQMLTGLGDESAIGGEAPEEPVKADTAEPPMQEDVRLPAEAAIPEAAEQPGEEEEPETPAEKPAPEQTEAPAGEFAAETAETVNDEPAPEHPAEPTTAPTSEPIASDQLPAEQPATDRPGEDERSDEPVTAEILLRGPTGSTGIETSLTDTDGLVACPGCGRRKPSPGPGRYSCSACKTEFVIPKIIARCPGCSRERPSPGPGVYQCTQCRTTFRIPPMISCPGCGRSKPSPGTGRLKCSACGTVFEVVNEAGAVR
jgi:DNA-directed RNA polymerase subunit RPC12/RpoP